MQQRLAFQVTSPSLVYLRDLPGQAVRRRTPPWSSDVPEARHERYHTKSRETGGETGQVNAHRLAAVLQVEESFLLQLVEWDELLVNRLSNKCKTN